MACGGFRDSFWFAWERSSVLLLFVIAYGFFAPSLNRATEHGAFYVLGFLLFTGYSMLWALPGPSRHGVYRAIDAVGEHETEESRVASIADRRQR